MKKPRNYRIIFVIVMILSVAIVQWRPVYAVVAADAWIGALNPEITYSSDAVVGYHASGDPVVWASTATFTAAGADRVAVYKNVFGGPGTFCMDSTCVPFGFNDTYLAFDTSDRSTHTYTVNNGAITFVAIVADTTPPVTTPSYSGTAGNAGWWRSAVAVTLSATDPAGPNVGSEPGPATGVASTTLNGSAYTGPVTFSAEGSTSYTYFSVDNRSNTEATQSAELRIDSVAPTASHSLSGTFGLSGWYITPVTVTLTASDATSGVGSLTLDGGAYTGPTTISTQGVTSHSYNAEDVAGNQGAAQNFTLQIDTASPTTSVTSHSDGQPVSGVITLSGIASDTASGVSAVDTSLDGGLTWAPAALAGGAWSYSLDTTGFPDGWLTVLVRATDVAGHVQSTSGAGATSLTLLVDNTAPTVSHSLGGTLGLAGWYVSDVIVTVTASDSGSGIGSITLDGSPYTSPVTASAQGLTSWPYFATDNAGNNSAIGTASFQIDSVPPSSTISSHTDGDLVAGTITLGGSVSDGTSGVGGLEVSADGGSTWAPAAVSGGTWTYSLNTTSLPDGLLVIHTRGQDVADNLQSTSGAGSTQVTVEVDNAPAAGTLNAPPSFCPACGDTIDIAYSASDANGIASWVLSVDGSGTLTSGGGAPPPGTAYTWDGIGAAAGDRTLRLTARDMAGNVSQITRRVTVVYPDPPAAAIELTCPLNGDNGWCRAPVTVNLRGSVWGVTIIRLDYTYDGESRTTNGSSYSFAETIPAVTHNVSLSASDSLGRTSVNVSNSFKIDGEVPVIVFAGATPSQLNLSVSDAHSGIVRWTAQVFDADGASVIWVERFEEFSGALDWLPSKSGTYEIEIFARDVAGNESGSGRVEFTVELPVIAQIVNPVINFVSPPAMPAATPAPEPSQEPASHLTAQPAPAPTQPTAVAEAITPVIGPAPVPLVTIAGVVFRDLNRDGIQDASEPGLPGVEIQVTVAGEDQTVVLRTAADGSYSIDVPGGKRYLLKIVTPGGLFLTTPGPAVVMEGQGFVAFGLGHTYLAYLLIGAFGVFGLVWGASAATDRRAAALRSLTSELQELAERHLAMRQRGEFDA